MNKTKFFSSLLVVALLATTSVFVSCKDYDDDIRNLQEQIDKKALISDLDALKTQVSQNATSAQNAMAKAEEALKTANAAVTKAQLDEAIKTVKDAADKAGTDAAKAINDAAAAAKSADDAAKAASDAAAAAKKAQETADKAVKDAADAATAAATAQSTADKATEDLKGALERIGKLEKDYVTADKLTEQLDALKKEILGGEDEGAEGSVASYKAAIDELYKAVTSVELVESYLQGQGAKLAKDNENIALKMTTGTVAENSIFGDEHSTFKGETHEYKAGDNIDFGDGIIVRVSPVSADLTNANILLVNSKGEGLDDYVEAGTPIRYEEKGDLIVTRGTNIQSGLWFIPFSIKADVTEKAFAAATQVKSNNATNNVLYAVAINNTAENDVDRYAVSTYDVLPSYSEYEPKRAFDFTVNKLKVEDIRNRWDGGKAIAKETNETSVQYDFDAKELVWVEDFKKGYETPATEPGEYNADKTKSRTTLAIAADNEVRSDKPMVPVEVAKAFTVEMSEDAEYDFEYYYVTLDERVFAVESNPSEWVAWNSYYTNIENLNKLIPAGQPVDITVNDTNANGDIIGFRVYAVNYDGTLVDPDGRAFYVQVGEAGKTATGTATYYATKADYTLPASALDAKENKSNKAGNASFTAEYRDKTQNGTALAFSATGTVTISADDFDKALAADLKVAYTLLKKDGKAATKWSEVVGAAVAVKNPQAQVDGSEVSFTLKAEDTSSNRILNSLTIGVKKELPSEEFAVEWRATLAPVNGVLTVYPSPSDATHTWSDGIQTITAGSSAVNPDASGTISWPTAAALPAANVKTAIVDLAGYANDLDAGVFDWIVKKVDKKSKDNDSDVKVEGKDNGGAYDNFIIDIDKKNINKSFDSEINAVYKGISLKKVDGVAEDYSITAWSGKVKFASIFTDLITYGNRLYNSYENVVEANKPTFLRDDYYYFYDEENKIYKKFDATTAPGKTKVSDIKLKYTATDDNKLISLFSASWKGTTAAEKQETRLKGKNAGLVDPDDGSVNLLSYIEFGEKAVVPGDAATLITAEVDGDALKISNRPGATCTSKVDDKIQITEAKDQFGATVPNLELKLTVKPETAHYNDDHNL